MFLPLFCSAGKTTLLDVLAGRKSDGVVSGRVLVHGAPRNAHFSRVFGLVEQFDSHLPTSTVREAVRFSADLRVAPPWADRGADDAANDAAASDVERAQFDAAQAARVQATLDALGLTAVAEATIGVPDAGGLSHELRKRVTIAVELVCEPRVLFLDEPSTSLDAGAALAVMASVRRVCSERRVAVLCTIHQPPTSVFELFDTLLVLEPTVSGARVAYHGARAALGAYVAEVKLGTTDGCPPDVSMIEWFLRRLASRRRRCEHDPSAVAGDAVFAAAPPRFRDASRALCARAAAGPSPAPAPAPTTGALIVTPSSPSPAWSRSSSLPVSGHTVHASKMTASVCTQFTVLLGRSGAALYRNARFWQLRLLSPFAFAMLLGALCWQAEANVRGAFNRIAVLFFCCTIPNYSSAACIPLVQSRCVISITQNARSDLHSIFRCLCATGVLLSARVSTLCIFTRPRCCLTRRRLLLARERAAHAYHATVYYACEFLVDAPVVLAQGLVFGLPLYLLVGLQAPFALFYFCIASLYMNGVSFATLVANAFGTGATANLVMSSFLTLNILFDGFLMPLPQMGRAWSAWAPYVNVLHYPHFLLVGAELRNAPLACTAGAGGAQPVALNATAALAATGVPCSPAYAAAEPWCWRLACPYGGGGSAAGLLDAFAVHESQFGV